jgi:uncharacterized membrane protein YsdA (DUF1294 family)
MTNRNLILLSYLLLANIVGFALMGIDKGKAKSGAWRIPERTLFLASLLGGSIGTWSGMYVFHHKTKHWYFVVGMPLILVVQIAVAVYLRLH